MESSHQVGVDIWYEHQKQRHSKTSSDIPLSYPTIDSSSDAVTIDAQLWSDMIGWDSDAYTNFSTPSTMLFMVN